MNNEPRKQIVARMREPKSVGTLEEFRKSLCYNTEQKLDSRFWPCSECQGTGWKYAPDSQPDPAEGNKMRERVKCPTCKGTSRVAREVVRKLWREKVEEFQVKNKANTKETKIVKKALQKLSLIEIKTLQKHGILTRG